MDYLELVPKECIFFSLFLKLITKQHLAKGLFPSVLLYNTVCASKENVFCSC